MQAGVRLEPCSSTNARTQAYGLKRSTKRIPPKPARVAAHATIVRKVEQDLESEVRHEVVLRTVIEIITCFSMNSILGACA